MCFVLGVQRDALIYSVDEVYSGKFTLGATTGYSSHHDKLHGGTISLVNLWDREMSNSEIQKLYSQSCSQTIGSVIAWPEFGLKENIGDAMSDDFDMC